MAQIEIILDDTVRERRLKLRLPDDVLLAQLVPALARKLELPEGGYELVDERTGPLAAEVTLSEAGIAEGDELQLRAEAERRLPEPAAPPVDLEVTREDIEAVAPPRAAHVQPRPQPTPPPAAHVRPTPQRITPPAPAVCGGTFRTRYLPEQDPLLGQTCTACNEPFVEGAELVVCPGCGALYHCHCWRNHGFRCIQEGCGGQGQPGRPRDLGRVQIGSALAASVGLIVYIVATAVAGEAEEASCLESLALWVAIAGMLTLIVSSLANRATAK